MLEALAVRVRGAQNKSSGIKATVDVLGFIERLGKRATGQIL
jgi:hypothetical protein